MQIMKTKVGSGTKNYNTTDALGRKHKAAGVHHGGGTKSTLTESVQKPDSKSRFILSERLPTPRPSH